LGAEVGDTAFSTYLVMEIFCRYNLRIAPTKLAQA